MFARQRPTAAPPMAERLEPRLLLDAAPDLGGAAVAESGPYPGLEAGVLIDDNGSPLISDFMSAPEVVDWNNDGRKDLLVGQFTQGYIWLFLNEGTDAAPVFSLPGSKIYSGASPITTSYG